MKKIAIVGAGAIGGLLAARLALAGHDVCVVDQGAHLRQIQSTGLKLLRPDGGEEVARPARAVASCEEAGHHDLVFLAVKQNLLEELAPSLEAMFHADTAVVTLQNGLPWWYFQKHGGVHDGRQFQCLDRERRLARAIAPDRIVGSVAFPSGEVVAPGVIRHIEGDRFPLGELDGTRSERALAIGRLIDSAGLRGPVVRDIRCYIWLKLLGNVSFNPVSALTHTTLEELCAEPSVHRLVSDMMAEAVKVGQAFGVRFPVSIPQRIAGGERTGAHRTSTLQDVEAGRRVELDALLGSVVEVAELAGVEIPTLRMALALMTLLDRQLERQSAQVRLLPLGS